MPHRDFFELQKATSFKSGLTEVENIIEFQRQHVNEALEAHSDKIVVNYDELTGNAQLNKLPKKFSSEILKFLGLKYHPLRNNLKKTGPATPSKYKSAQK
jgi:hypothetical protein